MVPNNPKQSNSMQVERGNSEQRHLVASHVHREQFSGPLPHPEHLERYGNIVQDGAERIFKMAENQAEHRMRIESEIVKADIRRSDLGLLYGFLICLVVTGSGVWITVQNGNLIGFVAILTPLVSIVGLFIYNRKSQSKDKEEQSSKKKK